VQCYVSQGSVMRKFFSEHARFYSIFVVNYFVHDTWELQVCERENVPYNMSGLEAIIFIADGDMRNALASFFDSSSSLSSLNNSLCRTLCSRR